MYLYAQGATITKTSRTKHLILRLGNTKESAGGYSGYQNIVIDGGTWNYNYQCVKGKDEPGGFVGFCIGHANNVTIKNATFLNNLKSHFLEFGGVKTQRSETVNSVAIIKITKRAVRSAFRSTAVQMKEMFFRSICPTMEVPAKIFSLREIHLKMFLPVWELTA